MTTFIIRTSTSRSPVSSICNIQKFRNNTKTRLICQTKNKYDAKSITPYFCGFPCRNYDIIMTNTVSQMLPKFIEIIIEKVQSVTTK